MTWWQTIIAVSIFCVCVTNAAAINGTESVREPVDKSKSIDDICLTPECIHTASWILTNSKFSVDPCDDFYEFACGNVNLARIPDDKYVRSEVDLAENKLLERLKSLIESIDKAKVPRHFGLVRTLYDNCMSAGQSNIQSTSQFPPVQNALYSWPVLLGNRWNSAQLGTKSAVVEALLSLSFDSDPENLEYTVPNLAVKEGDFNFEILRMGFNNDIVQAYYSLMVDTAVLCGATKAQAESELKEALLLGIDFAKCTLPVAKRVIITERANRTTVGEFLKKNWKLDLRSFIFQSIPATYNLTDNDIIMVGGDIDEFEKVLSNASDRVLGNWLSWLYLAPRLSNLGPVFHGRKTRFENFAIGTAENPSRWKNCVNDVRSNLGLSLSALYQRKYMSQTIVSDLAGMVTNMKQQLYQLVTKADWLGTEAKRDLCEKIDSMMSQVSYRDEYIDDEKLERFYEKVELVEGDYQYSLYNISIGTYNATFRSWRSPYVNDWILSGNILDKIGEYNSIFNFINIGAMLTSKNFYHIDRPKYINYGAFGFPVAHEISHSLDPTGIHFDKQMKVREWWSPETKQRYDERIQCLVNQYGNYTVEELGVKVQTSMGSFFVNQSVFSLRRTLELVRDFDRKYPDKKNAIEENWPRVRNHLIKLFTGPRQPSEKSFFAKIVKLGTPTGDGLDSVLLLLSNAFPISRQIGNSSAKSRKRQRNNETAEAPSKKWNPWKVEARQRFIFSVQDFRVDPNEQNLQSCPLDIIHGITNMTQQCDGQYYVVNKW